MKKFAGFACGGVINKSLFDSDPMAYMMCYYMDDDRFEEYKKLLDVKQRWAEKEAKKFFNKFAKSAI